MSVHLELELDAAAEADLRFAALKLAMEVEREPFTDQQNDLAGRTLTTAQTFVDFIFGKAEVSA